MTTITDQPKSQFRLSMLLYDTRYRSATIQVIAMLAFMLLAAWLISNTAQNLAALGKPIDFGFFGERSGYDINQRLLEYTSNDSHLRASFIGPSLSVPIVDGRLKLGTWQQIVLVDFDTHPRTRSFLIHVMGE